MNNNHLQQDTKDSENPILENVYPHLTPDQREEAIYNLRRYINLVWRIYHRLKRENSKLLTKELLNARFKQPHR